MAKSTARRALIYDQLGRGYRTRYVQSTGIIVAQDRVAEDVDSAILADVLTNQTLITGLFVAPCAGEIARVYANAAAFVDMAASGTVTAKLSKAVIGASDVDASATMAIGADTVPTAETSVDAVLSATLANRRFIQGQLLYWTVVVSNHVVSVKSSALTLCAEWFPLDR